MSGAKPRSETDFTAFLSSQNTSRVCLSYIDVLSEDILCILSSKKLPKRLGCVEERHDFMEMISVLFKRQIIAKPILVCLMAKCTYKT